MTSVRLGCVIMAKNEEENILRSLKSITPATSVDGDGCEILFFYDTGSTDKTISIVEDWCKKNNIKLFLKKGEFVDFSVSRNVSLDFARDTNAADWFILLDSNDELHGAKKLKEHLRNISDKDGFTNDALYIRQRWKVGENNFMKFKNHRCIRSDTTMRYTGVVHECLVESRPDLGKRRAEVFIPEDEVEVYQDRLLDTTQSSDRRWVRDEKLLTASYKKQKDPRTIFYLAQTCKCLKKYEASRLYYKERLKYQGFFEERYVSAYEVGVISLQLASQPFMYDSKLKSSCEQQRIDYENRKEENWNMAQAYLLKASQLLARSEPLIALGKYHLERKEFEPAYMYLLSASRVPNPVQTLLWYDENVYTYEIYHLLGRVCFYVQDYQRGYDACLKAIEVMNQEIDRSNLEFYKNVLPPKVSNFNSSSTSFRDGVENKEVPKSKVISLDDLLSSKTSNALNKEAKTDPKVKEPEKPFDPLSLSSIFAKSK